MEPETILRNDAFKSRANARVQEQPLALVRFAIFSAMHSEKGEAPVAPGRPGLLILPHSSTRSAVPSRLAPLTGWPGCVPFTSALRARPLSSVKEGGGHTALPVEIPPARESAAGWSAVKLHSLFGLSLPLNFLYSIKCGGSWIKEINLCKNSK